MTKKLFWKTEKRRVSELLPFKQNPRVLVDKQREDLIKSIKTFGLVEIPAIDTDGKILAGHQRVAVLQLLNRGNEMIDVRVPSRPLTNKEYKTYLLTSNRVHGDWNYGMLAEYFDIDTLLVSGFDDGDLALIFDDISVEDDDFRIEDEIKKAKKTNVKLGNLYQLGNHKILCADSTDPASVKKLMKGKSASTLIFDPPYNIGLSYDRGIGGKGNYGGTVDDSKSDQEYQKLLHSAISNGLSVCAKDAHIFVYHDPRYTWLLQKIYKDLGIAYKRTCLWIKNNSTPTPNVAFNRQYEPVLYGTIGKPYLSNRAFNFSEVLNTEIGSGNKTIDDIYDLFDLWLAKRVNGADYTHPTEKPPSLHERPLRRCTRPDDIVLDLFSGSSSLMVACEQLKRSAYMVEREPLFVQLAINRYEKFSKKKAKKLN
jgi:DNA modification methylase